MLRAPENFRYRVDRLGRQHFNFEQRIWLVPAVPMACTRVRSTALITLAANLLSLGVAAHSSHPGVGGSSRRAFALAREFSEECLLTAPERGWVIPGDAIRAWVESRERSRPRRTRSAPGRRAAGLQRSRASVAAP